ncbi:MAG: glutamate-5-semialdehyde dehydrogenase [Gammaproteobacteria bacterium]
MIKAAMILIGKNARTAARTLALLDKETKKKALYFMADAIRQHQTDILTANKKDRDAAQQKNLSNAMLDRLTLNTLRIESMAVGLEAIANLPDPVGKTLANIKRPNGLDIMRVSVPIGVIGVIYESRPNVTVDAAGLCLKSGNAVILRGGSESFHSSQALVHALHKGLQKAALPLTVIQIIPTPDRAAVDEMLKLDHFIDVLIPRGGSQLIEYVTANSHIPVFKHLAGLCHTYIHEAADKEMAKIIVLNAKMRRTGICGATEILLVDKSITQSHLPSILEDLIQAGCEIRGDHNVVKLDPRIKLAQADDYDTEFLDAIIAVKIVENLSAAIQHIANHSTQHTEAIITNDKTAAERFLKEVDSAIVMHNASTQFADGGEFGMGAEIGIATGKLHARGPVGVEQLTTFKYLVHGNGQVRPA